MLPEDRNDPLVDKIGGLAPNSMSPTHFFGQQTGARTVSENRQKANHWRNRNRKLAARRRQKKVESYRVAPGIKIAYEVPQPDPIAQTEEPYDAPDSSLTDQRIVGQTNPGDETHSPEERDLSMGEVPEGEDLMTGEDLEVDEEFDIELGQQHAMDAGPQTSQPPPTGIAGYSALANVRTGIRVMGEDTFAEEREDEKEDQVEPGTEAFPVESRRKRAQENPLGLTPDMDARSLAQAISGYIQGMGPQKYEDLQQLVTPGALGMELETIDQHPARSGNLLEQAVTIGENEGMFEISGHGSQIVVSQLGKKMAAAGPGRMAREFLSGGIDFGALQDALGFAPGFDLLEMGLYSDLSNAVDREDEGQTRQYLEEVSKAFPGDESAEDLQQVAQEDWQGFWNEQRAI